MADVCSDTWCATDIVEAERGNEGVDLEEERQGLTDSSASTEDGDLRMARGRGGESARVGGGAESRASQHGEWRREERRETEERNKSGKEGMGKDGGEQPGFIY